MSRYRNERFKAGNKVDLFYNPAFIISDGKFMTSTTDRLNWDEVFYTHNTSFISDIGDVFCCSSFGGLCTDAGDAGGGYSTDYEIFDMTSGTATYGGGYISIYVPKDCFNGNYQTYIQDLSDKAYLFTSDSGVVNNCFISEYSSGATYGKYGNYGVNYRVQPDDRIKIIVKESNFDVMCQILMSEAIAVKSCDTDVELTPDIPDGYNEIIPYGGGSLNPVARQGVVMTNNIKKKRTTNSYEIEIKLLG